MKKKCITMKGKRYNHDNDLLFMPNGPATEPNRAREVGAGGRTVSKFNPFSPSGASVSVCSEVLNFRSLAVSSSMLHLRAHLPRYC